MKRESFSSSLDSRNFISSLLRLRKNCSQYERNVCRGICVEGALAFESVKAIREKGIIQSPEAASGGGPGIEGGGVFRRDVSPEETSERLPCVSLISPEPERFIETLPSVAVVLSDCCARTHEFTGRS